MVQYPGGVHRSMEDIKARYYAVARQLLVGREGTEDSVANNVLVRHPFNLTHERYCCFIVPLLSHDTCQYTCTVSNIQGNKSVCKSTCNRQQDVVHEITSLVPFSGCVERLHAIDTC